MSAKLWNICLLIIEDRLDVIGMNVRGIFANLLMFIVDEILKIRVFIVGEALFKLFDKGVESCWI